MSLGACAKEQKEVADSGSSPIRCLVCPFAFSNFVRIHDEAFASGYSCGTGGQYSIDAGADRYGNYAGQNYNEESCKESAGRDAVAAGTS